MSRKAATLLTINGLTSLPKVVSSPYSSRSLKSPTFVNNLSTSIERSDFAVPNDINYEYPINYPRERAGVYGECQNRLGFSWENSINVVNYQKNGNIGRNFGAIRGNEYEQKPRRRRNENYLESGAQYEAISSDNVNSNARRYGQLSNESENTPITLQAPIGSRTDGEPDTKTARGEGNCCKFTVVPSFIDISTCNVILEMYAKCGSMTDAYCVFYLIPECNPTSWDIMITWLAKNDLGDVTEGMLHFDSMSKVYGIVRTMYHYVGIVNLLGTCGYLDEALDFIEKMPMEPNFKVWETLMNLCRIQGNMELGNWCNEIVEELNPSHLSKESNAGLVPVTASVIAPKEEKKKAGSESLLEIKSKVHEFRAGDRSSPDTDRIYELLKGLKEQMKEEGYVPETRFVLHDIHPKEKEPSERLTVKGL
ncbi:hypothetical protein Dimus_004110 [Dionaea muscipula]